MAEYKKVGIDNEQPEPLDHPPGVPFTNPVPGNYIDPGVSVEKQALASAAARRDEGRPTGVPFVIPSPKNYPVVEKSDANPVSQEASEPRAVGKPHVVAPPASNAERAQCEGKVYPRR